MPAAILHLDRGACCWPVPTASTRDFVSFATCASDSPEPAVTAPKVSQRVLNEIRSAWRAAKAEARLLRPLRREVPGSNKTWMQGKLDCSERSGLRYLHQPSADRGDGPALKPRTRSENCLRCPCHGVPA